MEEEEDFDDDGDDDDYGSDDDVNDDEYYRQEGSEAGTALIESRSGNGQPRGGGGTGGGELKCSFEWGGVRRSGWLALDEMNSVAELLEAVVELGEASARALSGWEGRAQRPSPPRSSRDRR